MSNNFTFLHNYEDINNYEGNIHESGRAVELKMDLKAMEGSGPQTSKMTKPTNGTHGPVFRFIL